MANPNKSDLINSSTQAPTDEWEIGTRENLTEGEQNAILRAREHAATLKHRGLWSYALISIIIAINAFSLYVVMAIGYGWMKFGGDFAIPAVIAANFVETWALTKIAMKFYFNSKDSK